MVDFNYKANIFFDDSFLYSFGLSSIKQRMDSIVFRASPVRIWTGYFYIFDLGSCEVRLAMTPLTRGHPDERPPPLERPLDNVNLYIMY